MAFPLLICQMAQTALADDGYLSQRFNGPALDGCPPPKTSPAGEAAAPAPSSPPPGAGADLCPEFLRSKVDHHQLWFAA